MFRSIRDINPSIGKTNTGFRSIRDINPNTVQAPKNTVRNTGFDPSGFSSMGANRNKPPQLTPPTGISAFVSNELSPAAQYGRMINQGQAGGMKSISPGARAMSYTDPVERVRAELFDNRQDVSRDRLQRRLNQRQGNLLDSLTMFKPVSGSSNLLQSTVPGGPTIAETQAERARKFGPTLSEIGSDIRYGFNQIGKGLAEKGTPLMNLMKDIYGGITNFFTGASQAPGTTDQFASFKQGLNPSQLAIFNYRINAGNSPEFARQAALAGVPMAQGGVVNL